MMRWYYRKNRWVNATEGPCRVTFEQVGHSTVAACAMANGRERGGWLSLKIAFPRRLMRVWKTIIVENSFPVLGGTQVSAQRTGANLGHTQEWRIMKAIQIQ